MRYGSLGRVSLILPDDAKSLLSTVRASNAHRTAKLHLRRVDRVRDHPRARPPGTPITQISGCQGQRWTILRLKGCRVGLPRALKPRVQLFHSLGTADLLLLTKIDLASTDVVTRLENRIALINPGAKIIRSVNGEVRPTDFFELGLYRFDNKTEEVQTWINAEAYAQAELHSHSHHHEHDENGSMEDAGNRHSDRIRAYCITREHPISWAGFSAWLDLVSAMRGTDLLRVKGIVNVIEDPARPVVIHGVQHIFHPPMRMDAWPSDDHRTRIVFITRDIDKETIEETMRVFERRTARRSRSQDRL